MPAAGSLGVVTSPLPPSNRAPGIPRDGYVGRVVVAVTIVALAYLVFEPVSYTHLTLPTIYSV